MPRLHFVPDLSRCAFFRRACVPTLLLVGGCGQALAFAPGAITVEDFSTAALERVTTSTDKAVTEVVLKTSENTVDQSPAAVFTANLTGRDAGWAGIALPVAKDAGPTAPLVLQGADHVQLDLCAQGGTRGVFITLTEDDGARWHTNVRVGPEWQRFRVPIHQFTWFMGPPEREKTKPQPGRLKSVDLWIGNVFQGPNGFGFDNVQVRDDVPSVTLRMVSPRENAPLPVQQDANIIVETVSADGKSVAPYSGQLWTAVENRDDVLIPQIVAVEEGRAQIPVFAREYGAFRLWVYEPHHRAELAVSVPVATEGPRTRLDLQGFWNEPVVFTRQKLKSSLQLKVIGTTAPASCHLRVTDHKGRLVGALVESVEDLRAGRTDLQLPGVGIYQVELTALAEPPALLPRAQEIPAMPLEHALRSGEIGRYVTVPDGITTVTSFGMIYPAADLPSTATIVGRDRLLLTAMAKSPVENAGLYRSPFGICSGALFHLKEPEIGTIGRQRLEWHRRTGSFWGRNDLWWHEIEPAPGQIELSKLQKVVDSYRNTKIKLLGILCYGAAWSKDQAAPKTPEDRQAFRRYLRTILDQAPKGIWAFEVWNEPNIGYWKPGPDMDAYRELVKATWEELRGGATSSTQRIVAGATAGYDPVFLEHLAKDGYGKYFDVLSIHPYPEALNRSPEENSLPEIVSALRQLRGRYDAGEELWITELGWPTSPGGVSELDQANFLLRAYVIALAGGINKLFWFNLHDWEKLPWIGEYGAHTGLLDATYRPKPSFSSYSTMAFMLSELEFVEAKQQGKAMLYSFRIREQTEKNANGWIHVAWTTSPDATEQLDVPIVGGGPLQVFDYLGAEKEPELVSKSQGRPSPDSVAEAETEESGPRSSATESTPTLTAPPYVMPLSPDDEPTTLTYRVPVSWEPTYIWDVGTPQRRRR